MPRCSGAIIPARRPHRQAVARRGARRGGRGRCGGRRAGRGFGDERREQQPVADRHSRRAAGVVEGARGDGKPVVLVLFTGRPLTLEWEAEHVPAMLNVWFGRARRRPRRSATCSSATSTRRANFPRPSRAAWGRYRSSTTIRIRDVRCWATSSRSSAATISMCPTRRSIPSATVCRIRPSTTETCAFRRRR